MPVPCRPIRVLDVDSSLPMRWSSHFTLSLVFLANFIRELGFQQVRKPALGIGCDDEQLTRLSRAAG